MSELFNKMADKITQGVSIEAGRHSLKLPLVASIKGFDSLSTAARLGLVGVETAVDVGVLCACAYTGIGIAKGPSTVNPEAMTPTQFDSEVQTGEIKPYLTTTANDFTKLLETSLNPTTTTITSIDSARFVTVVQMDREGQVTTAPYSLDFNDQFRKTADGPAINLMARHQLVVLQGKDAQGQETEGLYVMSSFTDAQGKETTFTYVDASGKTVNAPLNKLIQQNVNGNLVLSIQLPGRSEPLPLFGMDNAYDANGKYVGGGKLYGINHVTGAKMDAVNDAFSNVIGTVDVQTDSTGAITNETATLGDLSKQNILPVQDVSFNTSGSQDAPTTVPQLSNADMKTALGDAPYAVAADGNAQITTKDTSQSVEIVKAAVVNTDFGLANHIITGFDKDSNRYVYTEGYGWVKDISPGTPEQRTQIPYEWFGANVVNTLASLHYQDNPTIPAKAIDPQWWLISDGNQEFGGYFAELNLIPLDGKELVVFTRSTKPYGSVTLWLEFTKDSKDFVTAVQPNKNPGPENNKQLINMNWTFSKARFEQQGKGVDNIPQDFANDSLAFIAVIAPDSSRPPSKAQLFPYTGTVDDVTPVLQQLGEQLSLFPSNVQQAIKDMWDKSSKVAYGRIPNDQAEIKISSIPSELALKPLTADDETYTWGDIQP